MIKKEMDSYIKYILTNKEITNTFSNLLFSKIFNVDRKKKYPGYLTKFLLNNTKDSMANVSLNDNIKFKLNIIHNNTNFKSLLIPLATKKILIHLDFNWDISFRDQEDIFALHRFGWIQRILVDSPEEQKAFYIFDLIIEWIEKNPYKKKNPAWESYSVSERIINWLQLLMILQNNGFTELKNKNIILNSIVNHSNYLIKNLEFHGIETNNHIINNGRALYIAGAMLNINGFLEIGKNILVEEHDKMFLKSGLLKEGSTHYHLLLTRTYLEVLWIAEMIKDYEFAKKISDFLLPMLECILFLVPSKKSYFSLIGDISPDYPPAWLNGLPAIAEQILGNADIICEATVKGWHSLWLPRKNNFRKKDEYEIQHKDQLFQRINNELCRFTNKDYSIIWNINSEWTKTILHGHGDGGSFELHWKGLPILVDTGRPTYMGDTWGKFTKSASNHNSIIIDGYEPFVINNLNGFRFMVPEYKKSKMEVDIKTNNENNIVTIIHDGYKRIYPDLLIKRLFSLDNKKIIITDIISGSGKHNVKTFFHFHPDVNIIQLSKNKYQLNSSFETLYMECSMEASDKIYLIKGEVSNPSGGWYFPEYGKRIPSWTLILDQLIRFPHFNTYLIYSR